MKPGRTEEGRFSAHGRGLGTVTEAMVHERAGEIAMMNGRTARQVIDADVQQARRELLGQERLHPQATPAEEIPEEDRWQETASSAGEQTPASPAPDEQTFAEKLVEEGIADAEHDQQLEAVRANRRRETE